MIRDNTWSAWYAETEGTMEPDILEFKKLLKKHGLSRVLDFGCRTRRHLVPLAKAGFEMYGFDQSKSAIARTAKKLEAEGLFSNLQIRNMKMRLPYEDNFFDAVLARRVIMHARARAVTNMVKEIDRVLRIDGYVCLQVPSYEISKDWLKKCGAHFWNQGR